MWLLKVQLCFLVFKRAQGSVQKKSLFWTARTSPSDSVKNATCEGRGNNVFSTKPCVLPLNELEFRITAGVFFLKSVHFVPTVMRLARSGWHLMLLLATAGMVTSGNGGGQRRGGNERRRKLHRVQNGQCSYTFILPEMEGCQGGGDHIAGSNVVQRDAPPGESEWSAQKLQHLEMAMENNTQWLQKVRMTS